MNAFISFGLFMAFIPECKLIKNCEIIHANRMQLLHDPHSKLDHIGLNFISVITFSVLSSNAVDRCFESRSDQTKDCKFGICCFSAKHAVLRRKIKDWLVRNQGHVSDWGYMSIR